ncbi:hypothetical protein KAH37_00865 [bacterium]|nr:hypothetical protein [bacterium]
MRIRFVLFTLLVPLFLVMTGCNPEDEYLRKLYPKDSRKWAMMELKKLASNKTPGEGIVNKEKVCKKLLTLDRTPDSGAAIVAAGEIGCNMSVARIGEIADACFKAPNVRNLKTLESVGIALTSLAGQDGVDAPAIPILTQFFDIKTPPVLAAGQREKPESVAKRSAVEALAKMPVEGKPLVSRILGLFVLEKDKKGVGVGEDFGTKYTIAGVLGNFKDPVTVKPLVAALFYEEQGFSLFPQARKSLIKLGKWAEDPLIQAYKGDNPVINKIQDANKLRATQKFCPEYLGDSAKAKKDKKEGNCPKDDAWMATIGSIDTTSKLKTSIILADIRSKKAVGMVIKELEGQLATEKKQPFLAEHLAVQLAKFGDFKATPTLLKMTSPEFTLKNAKKKKKMSKEEKKQAKLAKRGQEVSIRMKGAEALGILGDPSTLPYLLKAAIAPVLSEYNVMNDKIMFYEPNVWASDAFTRMASDKTQIDQFMVEATKFEKTATLYIANVEARVKKAILAKMPKGKKLKEDKLKKQITAQSRMDVNYGSTKKALAMTKRFIARSKLALKCGDKTECYVAALKSKVPAEVEKAVYMIGFSGRMGMYKTQLIPAFTHKEPFVREALTVALLKTEDKGFIKIIGDALSAEGDKVEYAKANKEFHAISSYLSSL